MADVSRVSQTGQTTIPANVRRALGIKKGDSIMFEASKDNKNVILRKVEAFDAQFAIALESTLANEWNSKEDDEAYNDL